MLRRELEHNSLHFENKILSEKARLSQALHDKLGHSVNGSIYQLEACKLLIDKEPAESRQIIERVVLSLRKSMDEIRSILREKKPDKKRINALIGEQIWEVILDNFQVTLLRRSFLLL